MKKQHEQQSIIRILLVLYLCAAPAFVVAQPTAEKTPENDDFWLLLDYEPLQNIVWLSAGADEDGGRYYGIAGDLAITEPLHFVFNVMQQDYQVDTTQLNLGFNGSLDQSFTVGIFRDIWGNSDSLEKKDTRVQLAYYSQGFNSTLSYEAGDVTLYFDQLPFARSRSFSMDHQATQLSMGYRWPDWYTQVTLKEHDYEEELSSLQNRPRLQAAANPVGLQQASALAEREGNLLLGYQYEKTFYELLYTRIKSVLTLESTDYVSLRYSTELNRQLQLGIDAELPVNDVPFSAGLSLGIMW